MGLLFFSLALLIGIVVHEWGHYIANKAYKVKVLEFAIGMGPALLKFRSNDTLFSLRLFPIGGFVRSDKEGREKLALHQNIIISAAGVIMNLLLFIVCMAVISHGDWKGIFLFLIELPRIMYEGVMKIIMVPNFYSPKGDIVNNVVAMNAIGSAPFWGLLGLINFTLFFINILPLPVLDGGRILLFLLEPLVRKLGVPKERFEIVSQVLIAVSFLFLFSPLLVNNIWSVIEELGIGLFEAFLWFFLLFTIIGNIMIFLYNRKERTQ